MGKKLNISQLMRYTMDNKAVLFKNQVAHMKNFVFSLVIGVFVFALGPPDAWARSMPVQSANSIESAPVAFIGTVIRAGNNGYVGSMTNGVLALKVQKAIRGVEDGEVFEYTIKAARSSYLKFNLGERWLFLGLLSVDNSLLLENHMGQPQQANIDFVIEQTGLKEAAESLAIEGTLFETCSEWNTPATGLQLENGMLVTIFDNIEDIFSVYQRFKAINTGFRDHMGNPTEEVSKLYRMSTLLLNGEKYRNSGTLQNCAKIGAACLYPEAKINLDGDLAGTVYGRILIEPVESQQYVVFHAKRTAVSHTCSKTGAPLEYR
jgi:hypothetical protein